MRHTAIAYARAFAEAVKEASAEKHREIIKRFVRVIGKNGDLSRGREIVNAAIKEITKSKGGKIVDLEFARELPGALKEGLTKRL